MATSQLRVGIDCQHGAGDLTDECLSDAINLCAGWHPPLVDIAGALTWLDRVFRRFKETNSEA